MKNIVLTLSILISPYTLAASKTPSSTSGGRFQLLQLSDMRRDQYLVDTQTGKMWRQSCYINGADASECAYSAWTLVDIETISASRNEINATAAALEKIMKEAKEQK